MAFHDYEADGMVMCADTGEYVDSDDTVACVGCGEHYADRYELDDDMHCSGCAEDAADEVAHMRSLRSDYYASR